MARAASTTCLGVRLEVLVELVLVLWVSVAVCDLLEACFGELDDEHADINNEPVKKEKRTIPRSYNLA